MECPKFPGVALILIPPLSHQSCPDSEWCSSIHKCLLLWTEDTHRGTQFRNTEWLPRHPWLKNLITSLVQTWKNLLETKETRVQSLGREDPLEKEKATHSGTLAWKIPWAEELAGYSPWGHKSWTPLVDQTTYQGSWGQWLPEMPSIKSMPNIWAFEDIPKCYVLMFYLQSKSISSFKKSKDLGVFVPLLSSLS